MIFRAFDEFASAFPAVFWSQLSPADAAKLLAEETRRGEPPGDGVVAEVEGTKAVLRIRPFILNPFAPIFEGDLRTTSDGSQLVGEFRRRKIVLLFCGLSYLVLLPCIPFALVATPLMSIWLGASLFWGVVAGAFSALALIGILFAVAIAMRIGMHAASRDASRISEHIDHVFHHGAA